MVEKSDNFDEWLAIRQSFPHQKFTLSKFIAITLFVRGWMPEIHQCFACQTF